MLSKKGALASFFPINISEYLVNNPVFFYNKNKLLGEERAYG